jgi:hypothetical protein
MVDSGVRVLCHIQVTDAVTRDGRIDAVIIGKNAGLVAIRLTWSSIAPVTPT